MSHNSAPFPSVELTPIQEAISIVVSPDKLVLPTGIRAAVDNYWQQRVTDNAHLRNGEVFTVTNVIQTPDRTDISLAETDYAHYLYSQHIVPANEYAVRIVHPSAIIVTTDDRLILGAMGKHTSRVGIIQWCGGGIDHNDVENGSVNIRHTIIRELAEELDIHVREQQSTNDFYPAYLTVNQPSGKLTVAFVLRLGQTSTQFMQAYTDYARTLVANGKYPEFDEIFCVRNVKPTVERFIADHGRQLAEYMPILLRQAYVDLAR